MIVKNPFGIRLGKVIHINELNNDERGLKCNCVCPYCKQPLIARMGTERTHHFSHKYIDCKHSFESGLHLYAKELISKNLKLALPKYDLLYNEYCYRVKDFMALLKYYKSSIYEKRKYNEYIDFNRDLFSHYETKSIGRNSILKFDDCVLEKRMDNFVPDIILYKNNRPLIVEINVTHKVDIEKYKKIRKSKISCLEIKLDLNEFRKKEISKLRLDNMILNSVNNKIWIYNNKAEEEMKNIIKFNINELERKKLEESNNIKIEPYINNKLKEIDKSDNIKIGTCIECGKSTDDWIIFYGQNKTCICRVCNYK